MTSITQKDKNKIKAFIRLQKKGPFKHLNDKECKAPQSEYIVHVTKAKNIYKCAVDQAWLDVCRNVKVNDYTRKKINRGKEIIADMLQEYFNSKPRKLEAFDKWYDSILSNSTTNTALTVGQAQKIINMSFKYIFCCEDIRDTKMAYFSWCHMPLDNVILNNLGMRGLVWNSITDRDLYTMIVEYSRNKYDNCNLLLKDFEIWKPNNKK
jgi:hypothetical protein